MSSKITWAELVEMEPRLVEILEKSRAPVKSQRGRRPPCANSRWYGYERKDPAERSIKNEVTALVGWDREGEGGPEALHTRQAYEVACKVIYDALPCGMNGKRCWCAG